MLLAVLLEAPLALLGLGLVSVVVALAMAWSLWREGQG